jgi:hypothetical protein
MDESEQYEVSESESIWYAPFPDELEEFEEVIESV